MCLPISPCAAAQRCLCPWFRPWVFLVFTRVTTNLAVGPLVESKVQGKEATEGDKKKKVASWARKGYHKSERRPLFGR